MKIKKAREDLRKGKTTKQNRFQTHKTKEGFPNYGVDYLRKKKHCLKDTKN